MSVRVSIHVAFAIVGRNMGRENLAPQSKRPTNQLTALRVQNLREPGYTALAQVESGSLKH